MTTNIMRRYAPDLRDKAVTLRAQHALADRRWQFGAARCACRTFGIWMRDGATIGQAARVALSTFRAFV
jgi:hypothetical protein